LAHPQRDDRTHRCQDGPVMIRVGVLVLTAALLAGCTSGGGSAPSPTPARTTTVTTRPAPVPTTPVSTGPTTAARAASCPLAKQTFVKQTIGMRLARVTVLHSGGRVVGCRFYAIQSGSLAKTEHLPGPNQPAVEITTQRYASATAAHNAFVRVAQLGANPQQVDLAPGVIGVCFQAPFDPKDHGTDYACAVSKGTIALLVRSVDTTGALSTSTVTKSVYGAI
jgi:hypothetical protein